MPTLLIVRKLLPIQEEILMMCLCICPFEGRPICVISKDKCGNRMSLNKKRVGSKSGLAMATEVLMPLIGDPTWWDYWSFWVFWLAKFQNILLPESADILWKGTAGFYAGWFQGRFYEAHPLWWKFLATLRDFWWPFEFNKEGEKNHRILL